MTDYKKLITRLAGELDHYRRMLLDDRHAVHALAAEARAALAADGPAVPEGGEPTDEELLELMPEVMRDEFSYAAKQCSNATGGQVEPGIFRVSLNTAALEYARAVLARWGRPAPVPVAVSERLPGPQDCDAAGRCWWWYSPVPEQTYGYWAHEDDATDRAYEEWPSAWLPAHALPVPTTELQP